MIWRTLSRLSGLSSLVATVALLLLVLQITVDVTARTIFDFPLHGTVLFISLFYMPAIVFLPLARTEENDAHISVDVVYLLLPKWGKRCAHTFALLVSTVVIAAMTIRTWQVAMQKYQVGSFEMDGAVRFTTWPSYFALPIGFGLMVLVLLYKIFRPGQDVSGVKAVDDSILPEAPIHE